MKEKRWFWSLNTLNTLPILNTPLIADCQQEDVCRGRGLPVSSSSSPSTPSSSSCSCQCDPEWPVFREDRQICVDSVHGNNDCKPLTLWFKIILTNFTKLYSNPPSKIFSSYPRIKTSRYFMENHKIGPINSHRTEPPNDVNTYIVFYGVCWLEVR